jgi:hypothetical protein
MTIRGKVIAFWRTARGQRQAMRARRSVLPPRRLTAAETEGYSGATINGGCAIQTIGMPGGRALLLAAVVVALAATTGAAWLHEVRPGSAVQPARTDSTRAEKSQPPALTADEERFATALWAVHREATRLAVSMSFAGIVYQTEDRDARALARKIEPMAKFFHDAEMQVRTMSRPPSLSTAHGQYVDAMALYANAAAEMLKFTEDGDQQRLGNAHRMDVTASEDMLRVGEVLWPGQYKPH